MSIVRNLHLQAVAKQRLVVFCRYLLELFLEALCLEWAMLICLMLRDPSYTSRLVRSARSDNLSLYVDEAVPLETLQRTRECLTQIDKWSVTEWWAKIWKITIVCVFVRCVVDFSLI